MHVIIEISKFVRNQINRKQLRIKTFAEVTNDVAFRKIFGTGNKTLTLISFLNAVLKLDGDSCIEEFTLVNPYKFPRIPGENASIIDLSVKNRKGRQFFVEMQVPSAEGFGKRVQYYTCRDYSNQIDRGEKYNLLQPTYFIGILDFNFFDSKSYLSHHIILNGETYEHKLNDIQFTFIELKKFGKKIDELNSLIEKWTFFIKNAENLDFIPDNVNDEGLREAYKDANQHSWTKEEIIAYDNASIAIQDQRGRIALATREAEEKGMAKGLTKVVENSWEEGMPIPLIAKITDLSEEKIREIIEQIKKSKA